MRDEELRALPPPQTFDNTMLSTYCTCPRKFYWFMRRIREKTTPVYFTFGRAWGAALNAYHTAEGDPAGRVAQGFMAMQQIYEKEPTGLMATDTNSLKNCQELLVRYANAYPQESWHVLASEIGFELPIPGTSWNYGGSLDCYIEWPGYGVLLREDKSTGMYLNDSYILQWKHATQVTGYLWALQYVLGEMPFGALMNIASKRMQKDPTKQFVRTLESRSQNELDRFMRDTVDLIERIMQDFNDWNWPKLGERNPVNCAGGAGKSPCTYRYLCLEDADPWVLDSHYNYAVNFNEESEWKPWTREGGDE